MSEPQDFESLDDLFRKTFDRLPENAASNGWDKPSDRVWQHIQATVQPPRSGWSAKAITMVSALAVTIVVGLYLFVSRADQPLETATPAMVEQPVAVTAPTATAPVAPEAVAAAPVPLPEPRPTIVRSIRTPRTTAAPVAPQIPEERPAATSQRPTGSAPLPGSKDIPPNTTVLNLDRLWATPLEPLPVLPKRVDSRDEQ